MMSRLSSGWTTVRSTPNTCAGVISIFFPSDAGKDSLLAASFETTFFLFNNSFAFALYRFTLQDERLDYPQKIELLSRHSDLLGEPSGYHIEPIPTDEDSHSLSAIIMDDDYYDFTIHHTDEIDGLLVANNKALIVLKANAYLNLLKEREAGRQVNSKDIRKHRSDVLKLIAAGNYPEPQPVNSKIYASIRLFLDEVYQHRQSLADALDVPAEAIDAFLDVLRNEIFVEE